MTNLGTTALSLAYLLPVALLALFLTARFHARPRWLLITVLTALPLFYIGHYLLLQNMQGWPSDAELPQQFRLIGFEINEPEAGTGSAGNILLWLQAAGDQEPRVHQLPYTRVLHQDLVAAGKRIAQGRDQTGTRKPQRDQSAPGPEESAHGMIRFEDSRDTALPVKE